MWLPAESTVTFVDGSFTEETSVRAISGGINCGRGALSLHAATSKAVVKMTASGCLRSIVCTISAPELSTGRNVIRTNGAKNPILYRFAAFKQVSYSSCPVARLKVIQIK